jgi:hypothetical protein
LALQKIHQVRYLGGPNPRAYSEKGSNPVETLQAAEPAVGSASGPEENAPSVLGSYSPPLPILLRVPTFANEDLRPKPSAPAILHGSEEKSQAPIGRPQIHRGSRKSQGRRRTLWSLASGLVLASVLLGIHPWKATPPLENTQPFVETVQEEEDETPLLDSVEPPMPPLAEGTLARRASEGPSLLGPHDDSIPSAYLAPYLLPAEGNSGDNR